MHIKESVRPQNQTIQHTSAFYANTNQTNHAGKPAEISSAKGMVNGVPIGWTIATSELADKFPGLTFAKFVREPADLVRAKDDDEAGRKWFAILLTRKIGLPIRKGEAVSSFSFGLQSDPGLLQQGHTYYSC